MDYKSGQAAYYAQQNPTGDYGFGGGNYQKIDGKTYFFPNSQGAHAIQPQIAYGNPPQQIAYSNAGPQDYPMNWRYDQNIALQSQKAGNVPYFGVNPASHQDYFQGGFQLDSDNIKTSQNSRLTKGYSEDYIRSLRINFQENWMPADGGQMINFGPPAPRELPKPIEYPGSARKGLYSLTPSPDNFKSPGTPFIQPQKSTPHSAYQYAPAQPQFAPGQQYLPQSQYLQQQQQPQFTSMDVMQRDPKINVIEVPREVTRYVPRIEMKYVEQIVEVPGPEKIPVPRPYNVDTQLIIPKYEDVDIPLVMSQTVIPEIQEVDECVEVEVAKYVPEIVPVDVYVPRPVALQIRATGEVVQKEQPAEYITAEQLQLAMDEVNPHLRDLEQYNLIQQNNFQTLIQESQNVAKSYDLAPPQPISMPVKALESGSHSAARKSSQKL